MFKRNISVCLATYNGAHYIRQQIDSILKQLNQDDELIIVDDNSNDETVLILEEYKHIQVKLYKNKKNFGVNRSFEKAITLSQGNYIFLADQDDVWVDDRVNTMINALERKNGFVVTGNSRFINQNDQKIQFKLEGVHSKYSNNSIHNIINIFKGITNYYGCTMMISEKAKNIILPFPRYIESHDLWIALIANILKKNMHIDDIVLERRIHGNNASIKKRSIVKKLWSRLLFLISIAEIYKRKLKLGL